jgi:uncharacterized membrane-anchored protein YitT (DUF2179 family)
MMDLRKVFLKTAFPKQGSFGVAGVMTLPGEVPQAQHLPLRMTGRLRAWMMDMVYIMAGCIVFVVGMNGLLIPHQLIAGGLTGAALLLHYAVPVGDVGGWYFLLNIPLLWLGWRYIGRRFMLLTAFGMVFFSLAASWIPLTPLAVQDPITAAIGAGVLCGLGAGLILRSRGSAGGLDILSIYLRERFGFSLGSLGFAMNGVILLAGTWFHGLQTALYSGIFIFICARVVDAVLVGINPQKIILVISDRSEEVARALMDQMKCGVTFLQGEGGFAHREKKVICSVVRLMDVPRFKTLALGVDGGALLVVNDISEVAGQRTFAGISTAAGGHEGIGPHVR